MTSTDLVPQDELNQLIASGKVSLSEMMEQLAKAKQQSQDQTGPAPKPKSVVLSDADKKALRTLSSQLADLALPEQARVLTDEERARIVPLFDQVKLVLAAAKKAEDALKEAIHGDIDSRTSGETDKNGHKLTEGEVATPDYPKKAVRGLGGGKSVELTDADLQAMETERVITHAQYLRMTHSLTTREVVPNAVMVEVQKHPELVAEFAKRARLTDVSSAVRMAKN